MSIEILKKNSKDNDKVSYSMEKKKITHTNTVK